MGGREGPIRCQCAKVVCSLSFRDLSPSQAFQNAEDLADAKSLAYLEGLGKALETSEKSVQDNEVKQGQMRAKGVRA